MLGAQKDEELLRKVYQESGLQRKLPRTFDKKRDDRYVNLPVTQAETEGQLHIGQRKRVWM